jgi:Transposase DDE domain
MLGSIKGILISKQAIDKRINESFIQFLEHVLAYMIAHKIETPPPLPPLFKRIIVHDSSTIRLPDHLAKEFPGSKNHKGKTYAMMKIQTLYDLRTEQFCHFQLTPFTINDQETAKANSQWINEDDLVIRDFGSSAFAHIIQLQSIHHHSLSFAKHSSVRIVITNTLGQQVAAAENGEREAGIHEVEWHAHAASGIYFYCMNAVSGRILVTDSCKRRRCYC